MGSLKKVEKAAELDTLLADKIAGMAPVTARIYYHRLEHDGELNTIAGILTERRETHYKDGTTGFYFVVCLTHPCWLAGDDNEPFEAPKGTFAKVKELAGLKDLARYLPVVGAQGFESVCEIVIIPLGKIAIGGGKTMWKFDTFAKKIAAKDSPVTLLAAPTSQAPLGAGRDQADDVIPF